MKNGMTIAMSIWTDDSSTTALDWLNHGVCDQNVKCGKPDLKLRNF